MELYIILKITLHLADLRTHITTISYLLSKQRGSSRIQMKNVFYKIFISKNILRHLR